MKRVDPDALHAFVSSYWGRADADAICPEVAEPSYPEFPDSSPKPYDYHADWTFDQNGNGECKHCGRCIAFQSKMPTARHKCPEQPTPSEPVIDEAVQAAGWDKYQEHDGAVRRTQVRLAITAAIRKHEELRGNAGISSAGSSSSSSASPTGPACSSATSTAAPAADPRRLTDEEMDKEFLSAQGLVKVDPPHPTLIRALRAVADAQLAKARVTISEAEIAIAASCPYASDARDRVIALLRRHGVEVK